MPIYEYECGACGEKVEIIQRVNDPIKTICPLCEQAALNKIISASVNFQLKGEGWYAPSHIQEED